MTTIPLMIKTNLDQGTDSVILARQDLATNVDTFNTLATFLNNPVPGQLLQSTANGPQFAALPAGSVAVSCLATGVPGQVIGFDANGVPTQLPAQSVQPSSISLTQLAHGTPNTFLGYDSSGVPTAVPNVTTISNALTLSNFFHIQHRVEASSANPGGGDAVASTWNHRKFTPFSNNVPVSPVVNNISGLSLSSDCTTVTGFSPGQYFVTARSQAAAIESNIVRLNQLIGSTTNYFYSMSSYMAGGTWITDTPVIQCFVVFPTGSTASTNSLSLDHWTQDARAKNGLGVAMPATSGVPSIYAEILVWKLS